MSPAPAFRPARAEDLPELVSLWQQAFGDEECFIRAFYALLPRIGFAYVAKQAGKAVAAAHMITCMEYVEIVQPARPVAYLYAVSVREDLRGAGIGGALVERSAREALHRGAEILCTSPAEESLYPWYRQRMGTAFTLSRSTCAVPAEIGTPCTSLTAEEYNCRREKLLAGNAHLRVTDDVIRLQELLSRSYGGGLFAAADGIFAASMSPDGKALLSECLGPDLPRVAASAAAFLGVPEAEYHTVGSGSPYLSLSVPIAAQAEWNLIFD